MNMQVSEKAVRHHLDRYGRMLMDNLKAAQPAIYQEQLAAGALLQNLLEKEEAIKTAVIQETRRIEASTPRIEGGFVERASQNTMIRSQAEEIVLPNFLIPVPDAD